MKIGIFDSGSGGLTTLIAIQKLLPSAEYFYIGDRQNCPYGDKTLEELTAITTSVAKELYNWGARFIVIACNTATTRCIRILRQRFPDVTFVGTEPAIKVAYDHHKNHPLLLATTNTIRSLQVKRLQERYYPNGKLKPLACPGLADTIESSFCLPDKVILSPYTPFQLPDIANYDQIQAKLAESFSPIEDKSSCDAVILGCTHYPLIAAKIATFFPNAEILDGNSGVARRVTCLLT